MHVPDGLLSAPVAAATGALAAIGLGVALRKSERDDAGRSSVLTGVAAAFLFAAQMVNFPVGLGVSGHLLGGVLAAVLLGPWAGSVAVAAVLIVQCLAFGDGGLTALGANFVNMGVVGSMVGFAVYDPVRRALGGRRGVLLGAMAAAWFSVLLAALALSVEMAASGRWAGFASILGWMTLVHAGIGVGEAIITGLVLRVVLSARPDLVDGALDDDGGAPRPAPLRRVAAAGLAASLAVAAFLGPLAFDRPDGLEYVGDRLGLIDAGARPVVPGLFPDYRIAPPGITATALLTATAGLVGTLVVFAVGLGLARSMAATPIAARSHPRAEAPPDAA